MLQELLKGKTSWNFDLNNRHCSPDLNHRKACKISIFSMSEEQSSCRGSSSTAARFARLGEQIAGNVSETVSSELLALTYGSLVSQLLRDFDGNVAGINKQLEEMGCSIGEGERRGRRQNGGMAKHRVADF